MDAMPACLSLCSSSTKPPMKTPRVGAVIETKEKDQRTVLASTFSPSVAYSVIQNCAVRTAVRVGRSWRAGAGTQTDGPASL